MSAPLSIDRINGLSRAEFTEVFGGIYEHSPWVARKAYEVGPFRDREALEAVMREVVDCSTPSERREILRSHPQLSGNAARRGELTASSTREQARLSLNALSGPEFEIMLELNRRFTDKFGFPGIVAVRLHDSIESVIAQLERRLGNDQAAEEAESIGQVHHIASFRLHDLVVDQTEPPG